jgi:ATP-dependent exoDNAse (exonuclease V) beta subunit
MSSAPGQPGDLQQRAEALDPLRSFCVTAPAGSGKTELLIQRFLKLLARVDRPEEILAITFTRKAAAEMRSRLVEALECAQHADEPLQPHARTTWILARDAISRNDQCRWQLLDNPSRLRIHTIDGFCASLVRQMPVISSFGGTVGIIDDARSLYRAAVASFLAELDSQSEIRDHIARLLEHLDNNFSLAEKLLGEMLQRRDQWLPHIGPGTGGTKARAVLEGQLEQVIKDALDQAYSALKPWESELAMLADYAATNLEAGGNEHIVTVLKGAAGLPSCEYDQLESWLAFAELLLTNSNTVRKSLDKRIGFPTETIDGDGALAKQKKQQAQALFTEIAASAEALEKLEFFRQLPAASYTGSQWEFLETLTTALPLLAGFLIVEFRQQGMVDYIEVASAASQALGTTDNPTDLALALDYRIKHIMVDEFQDTSAPQFSLLERLTAGWAEYNFANPGNPNTLFIVGDGMQSVYGFRDADVSLFLKARDRGIGDVELNALALTANFRSDGKVVDWVNNVFENAFPAADNLSRGAVKYSPSSAVKSVPGSGVNCIGLLRSEEDPEAYRVQEAEKVVQLVQEAHQRNPDGTIAILVRTRTHLVEILPRLRAAGLSWQAQDVDSLADSPLVLDLLHLVRALLNPADRIAWLAILRAPWCGLTLADLHLLAGGEEGREATIWARCESLADSAALSPEGNARLSRFFNVMAPAMANTRRKTLRSFLQGVWVGLGGPALVENEAELANAEAFFSLLEQHQKAGDIVSLQELEEAVGKLYAAVDTSADSRLQVMTLHKAKGLEFDTVIIPGLDRRPRSNSKSLLLWRQHINADGSPGLLISPMAPVGEEEEPTYEHLKKEQSRRDRFEAIRLLYVGATRAISRLHLLGGIKTRKGEIAAPDSNSLLAAVWEGFREQMELLAPAAPIGDSEDKKITARLHRRINSEWQLPAFAEQGGYVSHGDDVTGNRALASPDSGNRVERYIGTVIHLGLQWLAESGLDEAARKEVVPQMEPYLRSQLTALGLHTMVVDAALTIVFEALKKTLADERGQWLLDHRHTDSQCEMALSGQRGDFIVDRTFIDDDGVRWIVDYKSSVTREDQPVEEFLQEQGERYGGQLRSYRELFEMLEDRPIKTALYFPRLALFRKVEV